MWADFEQLRGAIIDAGYLTEQEFDPDVRRLDDPDFMLPSPIMWAAWEKNRCVHSW
jgi:hypothetical protein